MMAKIFASWSGMRRWLEEEMLAPSMRGRIRYSLTKYPCMDGSGQFEVFLDGRAVKIFSMACAAASLARAADGEVNFWSNYWAAKRSASPNACCDDEAFANALAFYRSHDIAESLTSENAIVRMFALLDRRVGKRRLARMKKEAAAQPAWLGEIYAARFESEGI